MATDLKIAVQEQESWSRRLSVTVPAERIERQRSAVASQIARSVRLPGFRKGKIPNRVLEQKYGASIEQETLDRTIQEAYREALQAEGFVPITQGTIDNVQYEPGSDLTFEAEFEVRPEIQLETVGGFNAARPTEEVGEDEVESVLDKLRSDRAVWRPLEEGQKPDYGDQVMVEITALDPDGAPKEGEEEARSYRFELGENQAIPDVEQAIMTLAPGEESDFTVKFPEDFPDESQRGVEEFLRIKLTDAKRKELPELDDEFAKSVGDFETAEALRSRILEDLKAEADRRADADVRRQLLEQLFEANPFDVPNSMVERYLDHYTGGAAGRGKELTPEQEERISQAKENLRPQAEWNIKRMLVIENLAEREGLRATQDEIDARVEEIAEQHDLTPSQVWIELEKAGQLEELEMEITTEKVLGHIESQSTIS